MKQSIAALAGLMLGLVAAPGPATAKGDLAQRATRLETLRIDGAEGFSITRYRLETGVFYRWRIESDGRDEYRVVAPELFRNSWIDQVSIEDREVKPMGLYAIEFDDAGAIDVYFLPVRPGTYRFYVPNLQTEGFSGAFEVE